MLYHEQDSVSEIAFSGMQRVQLVNCVDKRKIHQRMHVIRSELKRRKVEFSLRFKLYSHQSVREQKPPSVYCQCYR